MELLFRGDGRLRAAGLWLDSAHRSPALSRRQQSLGSSIGVLWNTTASWLREDASWSSIPFQL
jgi:hypothetical protein